jgi:hypothetical protein
MKKTASKINWRKTALSLLIILICGAVGFFIALGLLGKKAGGSFAWWQSMGTPPEQPRRIVGLDAHSDKHNVDIYVETTKGSIYLRRKDSKKWEIANLPQGLYISPCNEYNEVRQSSFANLPTEVVDCYQVPWYFEWVTDTTYVVILEDGSVWQWRYRMDFDTLFSFLCGGPVIGLVIGWGLAKIVWRRRQNILASSAT